MKNCPGSLDGISKIALSEAGFSLFEMIVSLVLVGLFIGGLLFAGYLADSRRASLEEYWQAKDDLELAYETTHRLIREHAVSNITVINNNGNGISFLDENNNSWSFIKNGSLYQKTYNGTTENLLTTCSLVQFTVTGSIMTIKLQTAIPVTFKGDSGDLTVSGKVYLRNI